MFCENKWKASFPFSVVFTFRWSLMLLLKLVSLYIEMINNNLMRSMKKHYNRNNIILVLKKSHVFIPSNWCGESKRWRYLQIVSSKFICDPVCLYYCYFNIIAYQKYSKSSTSLYPYLLHFVYCSAFKVRHNHIATYFWSSSLDVFPVLTVCF